MVAMPLVLTIAAGVVALLVGGGFFDLISDRFADDGGSANARLGMFEIFSYLSPGSIIIGPDPDLIDSIRRTNGLEWGIENPIVRTLLYQGAGLTILLFAALGYFLFDLRRKLRPGTALPILYFLVIINSFESVANRTLTLAQFARHHADDVRMAQATVRTRTGDTAVSQRGATIVSRGRRRDRRTRYQTS